MRKLMWIETDTLELTDEDWVNLAVAKQDEKRPALTRHHIGVATDDYRIHAANTDATKCDCGSEEIHKALNGKLNSAKRSKKLFRVDVQYLLDALAGMDGYVTFRCDGETQPIHITDTINTAVIMPVEPEPQ